MLTPVACMRNVRRGYCGRLAGAAGCSAGTASGRPRSSATPRSIPAHKTRTVSVPVHQACVVYAESHGGTLKAKLTTRPRTAQRGLVRAVTVVLK